MPWTAVYSSKCMYGINVFDENALMGGFAHISKDNRRQSVADHLLQVGKETARHAAKLGLAPAGELIGLLHDLGKSTVLFQEYMASFSPDTMIEPQDELRGKIDHSTAGAQMLCMKLAGDSSNKGAREFANLLALAIVSHHSGLIDCISPEGEDTLARRLRKPQRDTRVDEAWRTLDQQVRARIEELLTCPDLLKGLRRASRRALMGDGSEHVIDRHHLQLGLMVRILFSCLIDADRTDTANFESLASAGLRQVNSYLPWSVLRHRLEDHLAAMPAEGEVNRIRREISEACDRAARRRGGTYRLTVPTGGGKTLAALRFALKHACTRTEGQEIDRIIFVSPYISIVEQNAAVVREVLERSEHFGSVVLEHHSNLNLDDGKAPREHWRRKLLAENWDAPVVFTTMAQVLDSLFGAGTRAVRRLHTMAHAVIIFDEAQTLPVKVTHLFNNAVNYLVRECGSTVLMCTATQPQFDAVNAERGALQLAEPSELIDNAPALFSRLRRYVVEDATARPGGWSRGDVAEAACRFAQELGSSLVVLNTKRDVRDVFQLCKEALPEATVIHLSTSMCAAHRLDQIDALKRRLQDQRNSAIPTSPLICVSTNLIEAGVDIDFAAVIRDLAGLDSVAQAAGRCNRHGLRESGGQVLIVRLPDPPSKLADIHHGREAARRVLDEWRREHPGEPFPLDCPERMEYYFRIINHERKAEMSFQVRDMDAEREDDLLSMLGLNQKAMSDVMAEGRGIERQLLHQSFMSAADRFELIAPTQGIIVPYRSEGKKIIDNLCASHYFAAEWQSQRQAQRFTISLYDHAFQQLRRDNAVFEVKEESGVFVLRSEWYDDEFGLREAAGPLEELIG